MSTIELGIMEATRDSKELPDGAALAAVGAASSPKARSGATLLVQDQTWWRATHALTFAVGGAMFIAGTWLCAACVGPSRSPPRY